MFFSLSCGQGLLDHHLQVTPRETMSSILLNEPQARIDNPDFADIQTQRPSTHCCTVFQPDDQSTDGRCSSSRNFIVRYQSARSVNDVAPIEWPPLAFRLGETLCKTQIENQMQDFENMMQAYRQDGNDSIAKHNSHFLNGTHVGKNCPVDPNQGLSGYGKASHLYNNGLKGFLSRRESSKESVLLCLSGGFGFMLCLGVIFLLLCWLSLGKSNLATYHLGLPVLVLAVMLVQACVSVVQRWLTQIESKILGYGDCGNA